ncbi:hypothetical protein MHB85_20805 [Paenibacillus sp. FSL K6-4396]|nr:hypothetical protein [Paenibacillus sp. CFBP 13594]MBD8839639.1 hypothetical protein [Paenibacillus sp. CFBP 13594]
MKAASEAQAITGFSPEGKWNSKNPGITAIKRGYCNPSVSVQLNVQAYAL